MHQGCLPRHRPAIRRNFWEGNKNEAESGQQKQEEKKAYPHAGEFIINYPHVATEGLKYA